MSSDVLAQTPIEPPTTDAGRVGRNLFVLIALVGLWLLAAWPTVAEMAKLWMRSDTFAHGLVVFPISAYLVWSRRRRLASVVPTPAWPVLALFAGAAFVWCVGTAFSVAVLEHLGSTLMLVLMIWFCVGHSFFRAIAFPVLFLLFMAPVGEFLVPTLMHYTAEFTVTALRFTGVPVYQEGNHFIVPNGRWSVVEACSGIRYLISSLMVGTLYAYLSYRTLKKRVIFVVFALVMPVVANWVRAYLIVLIGYLSDNKLAAGVDHLIYGWVFFGAVILLMFWVGSRWADAGESELDAFSLPVPHAGRLLPGVLVAAAILGAAAAVSVAVAPEDREIELDVPVPLAAGEWSAVDGGKPFVPVFQGYRGASQAVFSRQGERASLYVAVYSDQAPGHEMVAWANRLVPSEGEWRVVSRAIDVMPVGEVEYVRVNGPGVPINVWRWYAIGSEIETSPYVASAELVWQRLVHGSDRGSHVVLAVAGEDADAARHTAKVFLSAFGEPIAQAIDGVVERQP